MNSDNMNYDMETRQAIYIDDDLMLNKNCGVLAESHVRERHYIVVNVCLVDPAILTSPARDQR